MNEPIYNVPASIVAGDSYDLWLQFDATPVEEGGTANLYVRGPSTLDATGVINGEYWEFNITPAQTQNLVAGTYQYSITIKQNTQRTTVAQGWLTVEQDLSTAAAKVAHAEKMIHVIQCVLEGRVTADVVSLSIAGRSITKIPITDLMAMRVQYYRELNVLRRGPSSTIRKVPVVFGRLT